MYAYIHTCTHIHAPYSLFLSFCYVLIYASIGQIQLQYNILLGLAEQHRLNGHSLWSISSRRLLAEKTMRTNKPTDIWRPPREVVIVGIVCRERSLPGHMEALKQSLHLISLVGPKEKSPTGKQTDYWPLIRRMLARSPREVLLVCLPPV